MTTTSSGRTDLRGRIALVTGASEGIGEGIAVGLARAGADVVVCSRRPQRLEQVAAGVRALGRRAWVHPLDVTDLESVTAMRSFCDAELPRVDVLVNAVGLSIPAPAWEVREADWDAMVSVGLKGVFFCCQAVGSVMRRHGYGKIVNLGSTMSASVIPNNAVYAGVKAALSHLTRALAVEWAADGIRVNALAPTTTATPSRIAGQTEEVMRVLLARIPLGRQGRIEDVVPAAVFLASSASDFMTGQTMFVDGGWTAKG